MVTRNGRASALAMLGLAMLAASCGVGGCAARSPTPPLPPVAVKVPVAVPVYCSAAIPPRPALPIAALTPDSPAAQNQRLMTATIAILEGSYLRLEDELRGCLKPEPKS